MGIVQMNKGGYQDGRHLLDDQNISPRNMSSRGMVTLRNKDFSA
jgi:hypothetical protein